MAIQSTTLTSTATSILPDSNSRALTVVYFYNSDTSAVTINVHAVPSGDTAGLTNTIYGGISVNAGDTLIIDTEKVLLDDGDKIQATASTDNVVFVTCSYTEI